MPKKWKRNRIELNDLECLDGKYNVSKYAVLDWPWVDKGKAEEILQIANAEYDACMDMVLERNIGEQQARIQNISKSDTKNKTVTEYDTQRKKKETDEENTKAKQKDKPKEGTTPKAYIVVSEICNPQMVSVYYTDTIRINANHKQLPKDKRISLLY